MREIQIVTASQLKKTGEAVEEGLRRVVVESNKSREAEVGRLFTGLKDVVEGMLSEPGLMRLRDVVSQTVCPSAQGETEAEAMKQVCVVPRTPSPQETHPFFIHTPFCKKNKTKQRRCCTTLWTRS